MKSKITVELTRLEAIKLLRWFNDESRELMDRDEKAAVLRAVRKIQAKVMEP